MRAFAAAQPNNTFMKLNNHKRCLVSSGHHPGLVVVLLQTCHSSFVVAALVEAVGVVATGHAHVINDATKSERSTKNSPQVTESLLFADNHLTWTKPQEADYSC